MKLHSRFNIKDKVWVIHNGSSIRSLIVGQITIIVIDSSGINNSIFDNFKPQKNYKEEYMCIETGIGAGHVYTLSKNIFATKEEAQKALDMFISKCTCSANKSICPYCLSLLQVE